MSMNEKSLKQELFSNLSKQGFHEDIKKQLRVKLIEQLKERKVVESKNEEKYLFKRVVSSLMMQQLQMSELPFTESIYSIECGFQNAHMTRNQLIELLTFRSSEIAHNQSIIQFIIRNNQPFSASTKQSTQIQTNPQQTGYTLQQKLMMVDQQYRRNLLQKQSIIKTNLFDRKKLQLQLEQKYQKEISLFKEFQIHKIKIKLSQQWRINFENYSNSIAEQYQRKYDLLRKKDKQLNEEYLFKYNQFNLKLNQSQKLIQQKIQMLDIKSVTVQAQVQNLQKAKKDFQQQILKKDKQIASKINQYDNLCLNVKEKIKYEVNLSKLAIQQQYQQKQAQSLRRKKVIDEDYGKLMGIKDSIDVVEKQNVRLSNENNNLRNRLTTLQSELKTTVVELGNKIERIETLKDDQMQLTEKNKLLEQQVKEETKKSKRYESQIISMRQELQKLRSKENISNNINTSQRSQSSFELQRNQESKKLQEVNRRLERLKNQRKKDIEKFKLQL